MPLEQPVMNHTSGGEDVILFNKSRISVLLFLESWVLMVASGQLYGFIGLSFFSHGLYSDLKDIRYEVHVHIA
jgi:hypothetical protein